MKEVLLAAAFAVVTTVGFVALPATAFAGETDDVALCAAAADAQGIASASDFRAKFVKSKGAKVRRVSVMFVPNGSGASIEATCEIKRGEVINLAVKA
jgi:hypothetical protein